MMRMWVAAILTMILTGCAGAPSGGGADATLDRLARPMDALAVALAGEDVVQMRRAGRAVIAIYDAGRRVSP